MLTLFSCTKQITIVDQKEEAIGLFAAPAMSPGGGGSYCVENQENGFAYDSILSPTILGSKLNGYPYSVAIMQQAAQYILGTSAGINVNAKYMRFKPTNADQLAALEDNDIDLFDYPLDYELVQEGDYYDDGNGTPEVIPWLYAVVPVNFTAPAGITSELLQQIHVPADYRVEKRAFDLTANYVDDYACGVEPSFTGGGTENYVPECPDHCNPRCSNYDPISCGGTGPGGGPIPNGRIPSGVIQVWDDVINPNNYVPVQKARVVAKRFLKVERTFTNTAGQYQFTKSFRNKVKLIVKFKNEDAIIKGLRGARFWQMLMPVKINIGTFRGNLNNIQHNVDDNNELRSRGAKLWAAATAHNNVQEYNQYANALGVGQPPHKTRILVVPSQGLEGASPMYSKRLVNDLGTIFLRTYVAYGVYVPLGYLLSLIEVLKGRLDMIVSYNSFGNTKNSAQMSELLFHELTHAAHFNKVGNGWYSQFAEGEFSEGILGTLSPGVKPYGNANGYRAGYIGLGESWAFYMGHIMTDRKYAPINMTVAEQGIRYQNSNIFEFQAFTNTFVSVATTGLNAHLNLLEDFSPLRTDDPFAWIPQGLYYDLADDRNDELQNPPRVQLNDNVSSYTIQELFNAIDGDITTMPAYRVRLLQENSNRDAAGVTTIFNFYNF